MSSNVFIGRVAACVATAALLANAIGASARPLFAGARAAKPATIVYSHREKSGAKLDVYSDGIVVRSDAKAIVTRHIPPLLVRELQRPDFAPEARAELAVLLRRPEHLHPYVPHRVLVVFSDATNVPKDEFSLDVRQLLAMRRRGAAMTAQRAPAYTNDAAVNVALAKLGVDRMDRVLKKFPRSQVRAFYERARSNAENPPALDVAQLYRLHVTGASVERAVRELAKLPGVRYVEPDWRVTTTLAAHVPLPKPAIADAERRARALASRETQRPAAIGAAGSGLPANFGIQSSLEGQMSAPGIDAVAAYDEIERRFGQMPGQGVRITNVSIGMITGAEEKANNYADPCYSVYLNNGPTTRLIGGQRYLDWPGMPLIPVYVSDGAGDLSATALACNPAYDPELGEIGLDFSMMAPLPNDRQRAGERTSGAMDLLGIAPGAKYRLVVPESTGDPGNSDIVAALLAAATQTPAPDVITASLGFGTDAEGFPGRYLEDDVITESTVSTIVNGLNVVVCISAGDGLRQYTNAAVNPSGGSTPTEVTKNPAQRTNFEDLALSTQPSEDVDSGAIDVGGTTMNDLNAANPLDPSNAKLANVQTFPETRWTGFAGFSSGFGERVNISAPSDNVVAMYRCPYAFPGDPGLPECAYDVGNDDSTAEGLTGGTSAAAPETAAAAAVAIQVARLVGHPFASAKAVRQFLIQTATPVAALPQSDVPVAVGPQLDLRRVVETLLARSDRQLPPAVARVDVMQRQSGIYTLELSPVALDTYFLTDTDPADIDLQAPYNSTTGAPSNAGAYSPITIAPAWENVPANAQYRLFVAGKSAKILSTKPYARLYPAQILAAAGDTLAGHSTRDVHLTYEALQGVRQLAQSTFALTFSPLDGTQSLLAPAPFVAPVSTGKSIAIRYDIGTVPTADLNSPELVVSYPGRPNPSSSGVGFIPLVAVPLGGVKGTIDVPVSALLGDGIYGIGILLDASGPTGTPYYSDFAYTRVAASKSTVRPNAPLLALPGDTNFYHDLEIPLHGSFQVKYDVRNVPGATGAILEVGSPGQNYFYNDNTFNNPNGSGIDDNGKDSPSVARIALPGTSGTVTISAAKAKLRAAMQNPVRLIATAGAQPAGEDGEVSTVAEDGIEPDDGGNVAYGYGVNASGKDGILIDNVPIVESSLYPGVTMLSSLDRFDQTTGAITGWNNLFTNPPVYFRIPGFGFFPKDDTGFYGRVPFQQGGSVQFNQIANMTNGDFPYGQSIDIPAAPSPYTAVFGGTNRTDLVNAMAMIDPVSRAGEFSSFAVDMSQPPQTPPLLTVPLSAYQSMVQPAFTGFDYDSIAKLGYMTIDDQGVNCAAGSPTIAAFNYATQSVTTFGVPGTIDGTEDFVVDPTTHVAALSTRCDGGFNGITFVNLATGQIQGSAPIQGAAGYPGLLAVDTVNHLVLAQIPLPDDYTYNEDLLSQIYVLDERGNLKEKLPGVDAYFIPLGNHFFTANGKTRTAFMFGPWTGGYDTLEFPVFESLLPFSY